MKSARFTLYTMHIRRNTQLHTHKSDIHEIIFFEASVELNDNEILSTCFYVYAKLLYLSHLPRILFLIYQYQFLFHCVIAAKPKIFWKIVVIPARALWTSLILSSSQSHPWWTAANTRCKWHYYRVQSFQNFLSTSRSFFPHGKKLFLFLKHQSSLNKTTVLSQESNNNFLYIWQTGFCIFFSSYFTIPSQLYFLEPEPLWLCLCQFLLLESVSGLPNGRSFCSNNPDVEKFIMIISTKDGPAFKKL